MKKITSHIKSTETHKKSLIKYVLCGVLAIVVICAIGVGWVASQAYKDFSGNDVKIIIPENVTESQFKDLIISAVGEDYGNSILRLWKLRDGNLKKATGCYVIRHGDKAWSVVNRLRTGTQTPVTLTYNNIRLLPQLASMIEDRLGVDSVEFLSSCEKVLGDKGFEKAEYIACFLPDSYEFYYNVNPDTLVSRLSLSAQRFWTDQRKAKAKKLGLTPVQVITLASIVEEETAKPDERPVVARLYLNRLDKGMKLQADPTVKFAIGDFSIKRVLSSMLEVSSPYNTYMHEGLPPGPIRMVDKNTIDAVLDAPEHDYIYMCARADGSGTHSFAKDYDTHLVNARAYQSYLDSKNIR